VVSTDVLARRRQWLLVVAAFGFLMWQLCRLLLVIEPASAPTPALLIASLAGFLIFIVALGYVFLWAKEARGRAALEDEMTQHNRLRAAATGFWTMLVVATALFGIGQFVALPGPEAARLVMIAGVVAPLLRFAMLERAGES
jgi:hypothetical protein